MSDRTNDKIQLTPAFTDGTLKTEAGFYLKKPSVVLQNNTNNQAARGSGSVAIGAGVVAEGQEQTVLGRRNKANENDIIQVGGGDKEQACTVYRVTNDGVAMNHGGQVYTRCGSEIRFVSVRNEKGAAMRYDEIQLIGE